LGLELFRIRRIGRLTFPIIYAAGSTVRRYRVGRTAQLSSGRYRTAAVFQFSCAGELFPEQRDAGVPCNRTAAGHTAWQKAEADSVHEPAKTQLKVGDRLVPGVCPPARGQSPGFHLLHSRIRYGVRLAATRHSPADLHDQWLER